MESWPPSWPVPDLRRTSLASHREAPLRPVESNLRSVSQLNSRMWKCLLSDVCLSARGQYVCAISFRVWHTQRAPLSNCTHSRTHTCVHQDACCKFFHTHSHTHSNIHTHTSTRTRSSSCLGVITRLWSHAGEPWTGRNVLFSANGIPSYQLSWSFCEHTHVYKHHYTFFTDYPDPLITHFTHFILLLREFLMCYCEQRRGKYKNSMIYHIVSLGLTFGLLLWSEIRSKILFSNQHSWLVIIVIKSLWSCSSKHSYCEMLI